MAVSTSFLSTRELDQQAGVAGVVHADLAQHLPHDDLNMLIVDIHALHPVDPLDFLNQVVLDRLGTADGKHVVGVHRALGDARRPA